MADLTLHTVVAARSGPCPRQRGRTLPLWRQSAWAVLTAALVPLQALYENMLVELPFAGFFLSKLLGTSADVDIHHLASLDPEVYRNLLFLKSYGGDVEELGLNFTVVNNDLGEAQVGCCVLQPGCFVWCSPRQSGSSAV